jgi:hypothetical protein
VDVLIILSEPERRVPENFSQTFFTGGMAGGGTVSCFQVNTIFTHGIFGVRDLGVFHERPGDKKGIGNNVVGHSADYGISPAKRDIMDFITVSAVTVAGDGALKPFQYNV